MKTKAILLIAAAAVVTLSFTFSKANKPATKAEQMSAEQSAPIGGIGADDMVR
jgi:uncharacterized secreted protein with C-terminal beta-propeller domain